MVNVVLLPSCREFFVNWLNVEILKEIIMGRGILLWLIGVPIPVIILLALFFHH